MNYRIIGANRETGRELTVTIEARSLLDAQDQAADMGLVVSDIREAGGLPAVAPNAPLSSLRTVEAPFSPGNPAHVVVHQKPAGSSSLGISALILGIIAFFICWIPFISLISIPISGLGVLLAAIGLWMAIARRGRGIGFAIAGGAVSGIALLIASVTGLGATAALVNASNAIAEAREVTNAEERAADARPELQTALGQAFETEDGLRVTFSNPRIGKVKLDSGFSKSESRDPCLMLDVLIDNPSTTKRVDWLALFERGISFADGLRLDLTDEHGNGYARVMFGINTPDGLQRVSKIDPGKSVADRLFFEVPLDVATSFLVKGRDVRPKGQDAIRLRFSKADIGKVN